MHEINWTSIIMSAVSGAFGVGVAYGTIWTHIKTLKEQVTDLKEKAMKLEEIASLKKDVSRLENQTERLSSIIEEQVGYPRCENLREACQLSISEKITKLTESVVQNREIVSAKFEQLMKFIGRVEAFMESNTKRT